MKSPGIAPRVALAIAGALLLWAACRPAAASLAVAVTWDSLLRESTAAVVVTPSDTRAAWERGRIYTYTHVRVDRPVSGNLAAGADAWVRTMGGVVDQIGQLVEGEAVFSPGQASLLFLHPGPAGSFEVTARGQGQLPVVRESPRAPLRVVRGVAAHALLARREPTAGPASPSAADVMHGRLVDDVARDIAAAWARTHAP